jgi:1,2-diacylglycerol 3-alpha-glucosyltransferase
MRIGLFTDSYHPSTNGITVVVDIIRDNLEKLGHEVYIVAPASSLKWWNFNERHVIRFPAIRGLFFDEFLTSVFFPPKQLRSIRKLQLDHVIIFTPAQIGLMGAYAAISEGIPLISQYSTDLTEYVERYPAVMPGVLALYTTMPFALKSRARDVFKVTRQLAVKNDDTLSWKSYSIQTTLTYLHNRCDAVISVSPKVTKALKSWGVKSPIHTIPTGVNRGEIHQTKLDVLRKKYKLHKDETILLSLGRVAKEKNIDLIIGALPFVLEYDKKVKLLIVGDFNYRAVLEERVKQMHLDKHVIFTGRVAMKDRWDMFALADIFCFPSITDTQALVVNEAALMSLPIVWCDEGVNQVLVHEKSGIKTANTESSYAKGLLDLIQDKRLRLSYGKNAKKLALEYTEENQTKKLVEVLDKVGVSTNV